MTRMTSVLRAAGTVVIVAIYAVFAGGSEQSKANCDVESVETSADAGMINGELDAGYKVSFTLLNKGEAGVIKVHVLLSTSEGDFTRDRSVHLEGGRSVPLEFFVHEPTINAGNIQSRVSCVP
jgi:hypothetical protein